MRIIACYVLIMIGFVVSNAQEVIINPNGVVLPSIIELDKPLISTPGHLIYNSELGRAEMFSRNFIWEGLTTDHLRDQDNDTEILLNEGLTQGSSDNIQFKIDLVSIGSFQKTNSNFGRFVFTGGNNTFIGSNAGRDANANATDNIVIGTNALVNNETSDYNIAIGTDALRNMVAPNNSSNFDGRNVAIGIKALQNVDITNGHNVALGYEAGTAGGNRSVFLGYQAGKDASELEERLYVNNTSGDNALIFGDFDKGKVVINSNGGNVEDALLINATSSDHGPMRIKVDGETRFRVHSNGGLSIGTHFAPFDNGLKVANLDEAGAPTPLYADDRGNVTRRSGLKWLALGPGMFRDNSWNNDDFSMSPTALGTGNKVVSVFSPIQFPDQAKIKKLKIWLNNSNTSTGQILVRLYKVQITPASGPATSKLLELSPPINSGDVDFHISHENLDGTLNELVNNTDTHYYVEIIDNRTWNQGDPPPVPRPIDMVAVGYEY